MTVSASNLLHYPFIIAFSQARSRSKAVKSSQDGPWRPFAEPVDGDDIAAQAMADNALLAKEEEFEELSADEDAASGSEGEGSGDCAEEGAGEAEPDETFAEKRLRRVNQVKESSLLGTFTAPADLSGEEDEKDAGAEKSRETNARRRERRRSRNDEERIAEAAGKDDEDSAEASAGEGSEERSSSEDRVPVGGMPSIDSSKTRVKRDYELNEGEQLVLQVRLLAAAQPPARPGGASALLLQPRMLCCTIVPCVRAVASR